jgi:hypothetical protein
MIIYNNRLRQELLKSPFIQLEIDCPNGLFCALNGYEA